ncbi:MAG TPA: hypothetical protein VID27_02260, partial [Blastocatellia bacterium]
MSRRRSVSPRDHIAPEEKISPAFKPYLAELGANDKRDAIVIFKAPAPAAGPKVRGRLRLLKQRLDSIKTRATAQQPVQAAVLEKYQKEGSRQLPGKKHLEAAPIGNNA